MSDATAPSESTGEQAMRWMHAAAAELTAAGLTVDVNVTQGVLDIAASLEPPGRKPVQVIVDEDGYVQASWWSAPGATPVQAVAMIARVVAVITTPS